MDLRHAGRRLLAAVGSAVLVAVIAMPASALAATFSLKVPAPSSSSIATTPNISVYIVDKYGIKGSTSFSMTLDGKSVKPRITYKKSGDYKRITVSFQVVNPLSVAAHTVVVKVKNIRKTSTSTTWKFTVLYPPMPVTIDAAVCSACHADFPAAHPMTDCAGCHAAGSPPRPLTSRHPGAPMRPVTPTTVSAHTAACARDCHNLPWTAAYPHVLDADCTRCHTAAYPVIPQPHAVDIESSHISTSTRCTTAGCHVKSLTIEHYRRAVDSTKLSCATCHDSDDAAVVGAIAAGSTACESCHTLTASHVASAKSHAVTTTPACFGGACHTGQTNAVTIHAKHGGCGACHAAGTTPTRVCVTCHAVDGHPPHTSSPASQTITIDGVDFGRHACSECHPSTDLRVIHGGNGSCGKCHPGAAESAQPWLGGCVQGACHASGALAMHGSIDAAHRVAVAPACTVAGCHAGGSGAAAIHATALGCRTCHASGKTPTLVCAAAGCHPSGAPASHASHPAMITSGTITINGSGYGKHLCSECHSTTELQAAHGGTASCVKCHPSPRNSITDWNGGCVQGSCHAAGALAMHGDADTVHIAADAALCTGAGCHTGGTDIAAVHATAGGCATCHKAGKQATTVCATAGCHPTGAPPKHASHPSTVTSGTITINGASYGKHLCGECHATTELQAVHGGALSCVKCHPSPRSSFTTWSKGCVQGDCHKTGTALAMHAGAGTAHLATAATGCTSPGCHSAGPGGTDVAALHASITGRSDSGCRICHSPGGTPTLACATTGCHPNGTPTSHNAHPATVTSGTIAITGTTSAKHLCAECHATMELQAVHGGPTECATCHPTPRSSFTTWNKGCVQGDCHKTGTALAMHGSVNSVHTAPADACVNATCHVANVAALHAPGRGCVDCHAGPTKPTLVCVTCHPTDEHPAHPATLTSIVIVIGGASFGSHSCSECHTTNDLRDLHGGSTKCPTCHPSPRSSFTTWNKGCVQGGCHAPASTTSMHGSIDSAHTAATGACVSAGCHVANVAKLHAPGIGCPACHGFGKTPKLVCVSAGCHPNGAPAGHDSHPATITSASFTINGAVYGNRLCSGCHATTELQAAHGGVTKCATCHPSPRSSFTAWDKGCVQGDCHKAGTALAMHGRLDAGHLTAPAPTCTITGCHAGGADVAKIHAAVGGRSDAGCGICHSVGKVPTATCSASGCHPNGPSAKHTSHPATITSGTITINGIGYGNRLCSDCHATTELQAAHGGATTCGACHPSPRSSFTVWNKGCVQGDCHKTGTALAMHGGVNAAHNASPAPTCTVAGCHRGGSDVAEIHHTVSGRTDLGCGICHVVGKVPTAVCSASGCHPGGPSAKHDSHPATITSGTITINGSGYGNHLCSECHLTTELQAAHGGKAKCGSCHPSPRSSFTTWNKGCVQGDCHKVGTALAMHGGVNGAHNLSVAPSCTVTGCHTGGSDVAKIHKTKGGCAACHSAGGPDASLVCSQCHPGDVTAVHAPYVGTKHVVAVNGCVTADCHTEADGALLHAGGLGCVDCHVNGSAATLTCATCHPGDKAAVHATAIGSKHTVAPGGNCSNSRCHASADVGQLHGPDTGCIDCHRADQTPSIACASCHASGTISGKHPTASSDHVVTVHPCTGSCHGYDVALIHANSQASCSACHPASGAPAATANCLASQCHPSQYSYDHIQYSTLNEYHRGRSGTGTSDWGWFSTGWILAPYTRGASMPCTACHDVAGTTNLHNFPTVVNGKPVTVTTHNELGNLCSACHGGTPTNWHQGCFDCHGSGMGALLGPTNMAQLLADPAYPNGCADCHQHGGYGWPHGAGWMDYWPTL